MQTEEGYIPQNVIGAQFVGSTERMPVLNELVIQKNKVQNSTVLMTYRYKALKKKGDRVDAYYLDSNYHKCRKAFCLKDQSGYWFIVFEEERVSN